MGKVKKEIKQVTKLVKIDETTYRIEPDLDAVYNIKILLTGRVFDQGLFDIVDEVELISLK